MDGPIVNRSPSLRMLDEPVKSTKSQSHSRAIVYSYTNFSSLSPFVYQFFTVN